MNIVFRVDASIEIGSGHVMRCLTLAKQFANQENSILFICRAKKGSMDDFIRSNGFDVKVLPEVEENLWLWTKENWQQDALETKSQISLEEVDLLVVDHYSIDEKWESAMKEVVQKIMVIDDLANRKHNCHILLDQNYYINMSERYSGLISSHTHTFLGPTYSILREEFFQYYELKSKQSIFVFFGSVDATNETMKTIYALEKIQARYDFNIIVVTGKANPNRQEIENICLKLDYCDYYCQVSNMAELMSGCIFSITAGGTITWERAILSLPGIVVTVADNQIELTEALKNAESVLYLGNYSVVDVEDIQSASELLLMNPNKLAKMNENMQLIFDRETIINKSLFKRIEEVI